MNDITVIMMVEKIEEKKLKYKLFLLGMISFNLSIYCHSLCSQIIFGCCDFLEVKEKFRYRLIDLQFQKEEENGEFDEQKGKEKKLTTRSSLYASGHSLKLTRPIPIDHKQ